MEEPFKKGFFEFIAAADAEKVHSQTIGWIFSNDCDVFSNEEKNAILNELLSIENEEISLFPSKVEVEVNDIDILITCGGSNLIIIENKIKSSQHSNQLFKYEYLTARDEELAWQSYFQWKFPVEYKKLRSEFDSDHERFLKVIQKQQKKDSYASDFKWKTDKQGKIPYYVYLTLIEEEPLGSKGRWNKVSYNRLHEVLSKYLANKKHQNTENFWILKSYVSTIQNLSSAANLFIQNPQKFSFVFTDGKKAIGNIKTEELQDCSPRSYIKLLRLETLLQKWFYSKLIEDLKGKNQELFKTIEYNFGETHGTALLDIIFKEIKINGKAHKSILQFQGRAIKLAIVGSSSVANEETLKREDLIKVRNTRKRNFAEGLSKSQDFLELTKLNNNIDEINSKISTPRNANGFLSINVNESDMKFWQVEVDNREQFVINKILQAQKIFQKLND
jgi:hypothetical protein